MFVPEYPLALYIVSRSKIGTSDIISRYLPTTNLGVAVLFTVDHLDYLGTSTYTITIIYLLGRYLPSTFRYLVRYLPTLPTTLGTVPTALLLWLPSLEPRAKTKLEIQILFVLAQQTPHFLGMS